MIGNIQVIGDKSSHGRRYNRNLANEVNARVAREYKENNKFERRDKDISGMPIIDLEIYEKVVVWPRDENEYDRLFEIYEAGGWRWRSNHKKQLNQGITYNDKYCVECGYSSIRGIEKIYGYGSIEHFMDEKYEVINPRVFYDRQPNISGEILKKVWDYFDERKVIELHGMKEGRYE